MADDQFISEDQRYGSMLSNLLNPPKEADQRVASGATPGFAPAATKPAPAPAPAVQSPSAPAPTPKPATPAVVTPSATPSFYQRGQQGELNALDQSAQAASVLANTPSPTATNAPLEQRRTALATPIPYRDPTTGKVLTSAVDPVTGETINPSKLYKPGIGTRIIRALQAMQKGGIIGALDPSGVGATPYGAPNGRYNTVETQRQAQLPAIDRQEQQNQANYAAESNRLKDIGTETRAVASGYGGVARDATSQQNADVSEQTRKDNSPEGVSALNQAQFDQRNRMADQLGLKGVNRTLYLVNGRLPDPRQATEAEIARAQATQAWHRQNPGKQPTLDDLAAINAAAGGYGGPRGSGEKNNLTANQVANITRQKNSAIEKAQEALDSGQADIPTTRDAMQAAQDNYEQIIGVDPDSPDHYTVGPDLKWTRAGGQQSATPGAPQAQPAAQPTAPAQTEPTPPAVPKEQMVEGRTGTDAQGNKWKVVNGAMKMIQRAGSAASSASKEVP